MDVIFLIFLFCFYVISENKKNVACKVLLPSHCLTGNAIKEKEMIYRSTQYWGYKQSFGQAALKNQIWWNGEISAARSLKRDHESGKLVWAPFLFLNWCLVFVTLTQHTQGGPVPVQPFYWLSWNKWVYSSAAAMISSLVILSLRI